MQEKQIQLEKYSPSLFGDLINYPWLASIYTINVILLIFIGMEWWSQSINWAIRFDLISTLIGFLPLVPLLFIWRNQKQQEWQNNIPNYLNVTFTYKDKPQIKVFHIPLVDIADIRSQAQSVGQSLNDDQRLKIAPVLDITKGTKIYIDTTKELNRGQPFEQHEVTIKMKSLLTEHERGVAQTHTLMADDVIYWSYPFDEKNILVKRDNTEINLSKLKVEE